MEHTKPSHYGDKRFYSLNEYCKQTFGEKVYRLSLNGGMTCPNRDGSLSYGGCTFCSEGGSGDFAANYQVLFLIRYRKPKLASRKKQIVRSSLPISRHIPTPMLHFLIFDVFLPKHWKNHL